MDKPPQAHIDLLDSMEDYARQTSAKFWALKLRDIAIYGQAFEVDGKRIDPSDVYLKPTNNTQSRSRS